MRPRPRDAGDPTEVDAPPIVQQDEVRGETPGGVGPREVDDAEEHLGLVGEACAELHVGQLQLGDEDRLTDGRAQRLQLARVVGGRPKMPL